MSHAMARPPISFATVRAPSALRSTTATFAPSAANARAHAAPMPLAPPVTTAIFLSSSMRAILRAQRPQVHHHALGRELPALVEPVERDEGQRHLAVGRREALKLARVFPDEAALDHDLVVGVVLAVDHVVESAERARRLGHADVGVTPADALVAVEDRAVVLHDRASREGLHDSFQVVLVLDLVVGVQEGAAALPFLVIDGHESLLECWGFSHSRNTGARPRPRPWRRSRAA